MRRHTAEAIVVLAGWVSLNSFPAFCQDSVPLTIATEADFLSPVPVVLSASRLREPIAEAPTAVTVIDADMIAASGFTNVADLFRLAPGFNVTYWRGQFATVGYHGITDAYSRRIQILVDGRAIYDPDFGEVHWSELPLAIEDIERIEVVRGPAGAAYGANAFLAVANIITRHPSETPGVFGVLSKGEDGLDRATIRYGGHTQRSSYRLTLSSQGDHGFAALPDDSRVNFGSFRSDYRPTPDDEFQLQAGISHGTYGMGFDDSIFTPPHNGSDSTGYLQARWTRQAGPEREWWAQYYHTSYRYSDAYTLPVLPAPFFILPISLSYRAVRDSLEFQETLSPRPRFRLAWGAGMHRDAVQSPGYYNSDAMLHGTAYRLFGSGEYWLSPQWLAHAAVTAEHHYFVGYQLSQRFALNYISSPHHSFRIAYANAYRAPTFTEQLMDQRFVSQGVLLNIRASPAAYQLRPERVFSSEIGYTGDVPEARLFLDARLFDDKLADLVNRMNVALPPGTELMGDGLTSVAINKNWAHQTGVEYQLRWEPSRHLRLILNQSHVHMASDDPDVERSAPANSTSFLAIWRITGAVTGSIGYYQLNGMKWLGGGDFIDKYHRLDARLAWRWHAGAGNEELALTIQNALGGNREFRDELRTARRAFATFRAEF